MSNKNSVLVVGLGEIGRPLMQVLSRHHPTFGLDVEPSTELPADVDIMHICYPFRIPNFIEETVKYIEKFSPRVTVLNSTVAVGTTREISARCGASVVNSPVRGKHARMEADLLHYDKFVGATTRDTAEYVARHFNQADMKTRILSSPEATELAKLTETTYFGLMIAWAQEVERYCDGLGLDYDEFVSMYDEVPFFPQVKFFPGVIGGHCVMSNIEIMCESSRTEILAAIEESNRHKIERDEQCSKAAEERKTASGASTAQ
jgi:UDP-N-acetyl-D-mannosaminuronate dehydrogenase